MACSPAVPAGVYGLHKASGDELVKSINAPQDTLPPPPSQAAVEGFQPGHTRRDHPLLSQIEEEVAHIRHEVERRACSIYEKQGFYEQLMRALHKVDSELQDLQNEERTRRKALVQSINALQDTLPPPPSQATPGTTLLDNILRGQPPPHTVADMNTAQQTREDPRKRISFAVNDSGDVVPANLPADTAEDPQPTPNVESGNTADDPSTPSSRPKKARPGSMKAVATAAKTTTPKRSTLQRMVTGLFGPQGTRATGKPLDLSTLRSHVPGPADELLVATEDAQSTPTVESGNTVDGPLTPSSCPKKTSPGSKKAVALAAATTHHDAHISPAELNALFSCRVHSVLDIDRAEAHALALRAEAALAGYADADNLVLKGALIRDLLAVPRRFLSVLKTARSKAFFARNPDFNAASKNIRPARIVRGEQLGRAGYLGKSASVLSSTNLRMTMDPAKLKIKLEELHPQAALPAPAPIALPSWLTLPTDLVSSSVSKARHGTAPGRSGWTEELLTHCFKHSPVFLRDFTALQRDLLNGSVDPDTQPFIRDQLLLGLPKPKDGVRPIAVGECITKTAASFGLQRVLPAANEYFAGVQYALIPGGAEVIIHDMRKRSTDGETIVTIDFRNAFNSVDRRHILGKVRPNG